MGKENVFEVALKENILKSVSVIVLAFLFYPHIVSGLSGLTLQTLATFF
jgi:hypothetical protein